jgi:flagella basal body P-ring formation protein FlgA
MRRVAALSLVLCAAASAGAAGAGSVVVDGPSVLLGDLAKGCAASECAEPVAKAPPPGMTVVLTRRQVAETLGAAGVDWPLTEIPVRVRISRATVLPSRAQFLLRVRNAVEAALPDEVVLRSVGRVEPARVPVGPWTVEATMMSFDGRLGRVSLRLDLSADGEVFRRSKITAVIATEVALPVAVRAMAAGHVVDAADIAAGQAIRVDDPARFVAQADEVVGRRLRRAIQAGRPFEASELAAPAVVEHGHRVSVIYLADGIRITAPGIVRQQGSVGDRVRVQILPSARVVWADVLDRTQVVVR